LLRPVGRPEPYARHVRQCRVVVCRHRRDRIYLLGAIVAPKKAFSAIVEQRAFLKVVRPIRGVNRGASCSVGFNGVLIDRRINHAQIVEDAAGLGAFARAEEARNGDGRKERDNGDDDHDFNEGETSLRLCSGLAHVIEIERAQHSLCQYIDVRYVVRLDPTGTGNYMSRLHPDDYEALAEFRYVLRKFLRFSKDLLGAGADLNPEQYEALLAIKAFASPEGLTVSQLSERLQVKHHSAVNIVDRLAERRLITREPNSSDRRRRHLQLTIKGEKLIEELAFAHRKEIRGRSAEMIKALERLRQ